MGPNKHVNEKAKDFKGSMKKLLIHSKKFLPILIIAMVLAALGSVLSVIGPNKLSDLTNVIQEGLSYNVDLTQKEYNDLLTNKTCTIEKKEAVIILNLIESDTKLQLDFNGMISTEIDYEQLQQEKYVSLDMYKMGVALRNDTLQIWVNTDAKIDIQKVVNICVILISIYLCSYIFSLVEGLLMATTTQKISKNLRTDINKKINKLPLSYIDATSYGNLMSRTTNDVDAISMGLNNSITTLIGAITLLIACLIMMFITNYIMALTAIASCLIGFILIAVIMSKSQKYFKAQQKNLGEVNGHIEETFTAHDIISVYNSTNLRKHEFTKFNNELYKSTYKSQFLSGLMPSLMMFIGNFGYVAICVVGAVLVSQGSITIGTIVAFMLYVRLFSNPLTQIAQAMTNLQSTAAASERVFELLDEDEISESVDKKKTDIKKIQGNVSFENVKFGYTKDKLIIKDFSAEIKKGQKVAIVGPTGAGKTTIVNLLMLFYDINSGSIKIDGKDIKDMKRRDLHNTFGMVLQDTWLFEGTVRENLIYNKQSVSNKKLDEICEVCGLTHFIKTLPNGYDTVLDDNTNISAGQKQLLTIARAMVQNAPMLILDEATSSIDTRTETLIQKAIDNLTKDRTSFVIAHRLSTIKNADIILVMKDGDIIEQGNHKELLRQNGFYAELYNSQFAEN